jgi:hypothetical protein
MIKEGRSSRYKIVDVSSIKRNAGGTNPLLLDICTQLVFDAWY